MFFYLFIRSQVLRAFLKTYLSNFLNIKACIQCRICLGFVILSLSNEFYLMKLRLFNPLLLYSTLIVFDVPENLD